MSGPRIHRRQCLSQLGTWGIMATTLSHSAGNEPPRPPFVTALVFDSVDRLLVASESQIEVVHWPSLRRLATWPVAIDKVSALERVQWSDGTTELVIAGGTPGEQGVLAGLDLATGELRWSQPAGDDVLRCVSADPASNQLAAGGHDQRVYVWQRQATGDVGQATVLVDHTGPVTGVLCLGDQQLVSASLDQSLRLWKVTKPSPTRILQQHTGGVNGLLSLPNSGSGLPQCLSFARDKTVRLWQPTIGRLLRLARLPAVGDSACRHHEPMKAWIGSEAGTVFLLDLATVKVIDTLTVADSPLLALQREPAGERWVSGGPAGLVSQGAQ